MRRTFASHLEDLGTPRTVIAALLNHAGASVTDVYTRGELRCQKRNAVERLGELIAGTARETRPADNLVYLKR